MKRTPLLALMFVVVAACGGGMSAAGMQLRLTQDDAPKANKETIAHFATSPLFLAEIVDARTVKDLGVAEDNNARATTPNPVGPAVHAALSAELEKAGVILESGQPKELALAAELRQFFVREGGSFNASVQIQFTLTRAGEKVWTKVLMAEGSTHGRSHSPDNYNQALSEATHNVTSKLLTDIDFQEAVTGQKAERPAPPVVDSTPNPKMKLEWKAPEKPLTPNPAVLSALLKAKIIMPPFTNSRIKQNEIALAKENNQTMHTPDKVEAFVDTVVRNELTARGVRFEEGKTSLTLIGDVVEFFVNEDDKFVGVVRIRFTLKKGDKELWTDVVEGTSKVHGHDHEKAAYNESLSTALAGAMTSLLTNKGFGAALKK